MKNRMYLRHFFSAFLLMLAYSLITSAITLMVLPVVNRFGFSRGTFTVTSTLIMLPYLALSPFLGTLCAKIGLRRIVRIGAVCGAVSLFAMSFCHTLAQFYLAFLFGGLVFGPCSNYVASVLLNNWFEKKRSFVCAVIMTGTGVGGVLWGMIVPALVDDFDYRAGYRFCSAAWFVLMTLCSLLICGLPDDVGVIPYGADKQQPTESLVCESPAARRGLLLQPKFRLLCLANFSLSLINSFYPHAQSYLVDHGYTVISAGWVLSLFSLVLVVCKLALGVHFEHCGLHRGILFPAALDLISLILLLSGSTPLLCIAIVLFAVNSSLVALTPLLSAGQVYNAQEFAAVWGILSCVSSVGNTVGVPLWGLLYDVGGSYQMGFVLSVVLLGSWLSIYRYLLGRT